MVEYKYPEAKVKKVEETKLNINSLSDLMKELEARSNKLKETPLPQDELSQLLGLKLNGLIIITSRLNLVNDLVDHVKGTKSKFDRIEEIKKMDKESRKKYLDEYLKLVLETKGINKETVFNVYSKLEGRKTELENTLKELMDSGREFLEVYDKLYDLAVQYNENLTKINDYEQTIAKLQRAGKPTKTDKKELDKLKTKNRELESSIQKYKAELNNKAQINKDLEQRLDKIKSGLEALKQKYPQMAADIDAIMGLTPSTTTTTTVPVSGAKITTSIKTISDIHNELLNMEKSTVTYFIKDLDLNDSNTKKFKEDVEKGNITTYTVNNVKWNVSFIKIGPNDALIFKKPRK
jgi:chromosome segregation ATPase